MGEKKKNVFMKIGEIIKQSLFKGSKPSSSRIMSYIMMAIIFLSGLTAIGIELVNAIIAWKQGGIYTIPWEHITILGMWLAHQLTLLGIYKRSEVSIPKIEDKKEDKTNEEG